MGVTGPHFDHVTVNTEPSITSVNLAQYAPNLTCLSVVIQIYVFHWFRKWAGPNGSLAPPKLQAQGSLSCTCMTVGGHNASHLDLQKSLLTPYAKLNRKSAILNQTAIFGDLHVVYFNKVLLGILSDFHDTCCVYS